MKCLLFVLLLFVYANNNSFAQKKDIPILILGYVYDNFTGAGIKDAKVTLMDKDSTVIGESPTYIGNFMHGGTNGIDASYDFELKKISR